MRKLAFFIIFLLSTSLPAQVLSRVRIYSQLGTCSKDGVVVMINDALTAGTCAGGGTALAVCWCDLSTTTWISQPIDTSALGLSDFVLKNSTEAISISSDTEAAISSGAAQFSVSQGFASILGDIDILAAGDGEHVVFSMGGGNSWSINGGSSGFAAYDVTFEGAASSIWQYGSGGEDCHLDLESGGWYFDCDPSGSNTAAELTITDKKVILSGSVALPRANTVPFACNSAGLGGYTYYDTDINEPCYCNGSAWVAYDGAGDCS